MGNLQTDINCDMGEGFGNYPSYYDEELMKHISSANIACGFHAGDPSGMQTTIQAAIKHNLALGAHPGLPDLQGFGRRNMSISAAEAYQITLYQIGALSAFAKAAGSRLNHVKPHGALYNMAAKDLQLAKAITQAVFDFDPELIFYGLAGSKMIEAAASTGLKAAREAFADRTYQRDGLLTPRSQADAMIDDPQKAVNQIITLLKEQTIVAADGSVIKMEADTFCIHGDSAGAAQFARAIRAGLENAHIVVNPIKL